MVQTSASGQTAAEKAAANADAKVVILTHEYYTWSVCVCSQSTLLPGIYYLKTGVDISQASAEAKAAAQAK